MTILSAVCSHFQAAWVNPLSSAKPNPNNVIFDFFTGFIPQLCLSSRIHDVYDENIVSRIALRLIVSKYTPGFFLRPEIKIKPKQRFPNANSKSAAS